MSRRRSKSGAPKGARELARRMRLVSRPTMVCVAPGVYRPKDPAEQVPEVTISAWCRQSDGSYRPVPVQENFVRLDPRLASMLGFKGTTFNTLRRLGHAGFVEIIPIAPQTTFINLTSWYNHLKRCVEDPEFWSPGKGNLEHYRMHLGARINGGWRRRD